MINNNIAQLIASEKVSESHFKKMRSGKRRRFHNQSTKFTDITFGPISAVMCQLPYLITMHVSRPLRRVCKRPDWPCKKIVGQIMRRISLNVTNNTWHLAFRIEMAASTTSLNCSSLRKGTTHQCSYWSTVLIGTNHFNSLYWTRALNYFSWESAVSMVSIITQAPIQVFFTGGCNRRDPQLWKCVAWSRIYRPVCAVCSPKKWNLRDSHSWIRLKLKHVVDKWV